MPSNAFCLPEIKLIWNEAISDCITTRIKAPNDLMPGVSACAASVKHSEPGKSNNLNVQTEQACCLLGFVSSLRFLMQVMI